MNQDFQVYQKDVEFHKNNGRVQVGNTLYNNPEQRQSNCSFVSEAVSHQIRPTPLSNLFFSDLNIDALQSGLKNRILNLSEGKYSISRQSDTELKIIMRSIYLQHAKHYTYIPINEQVRDLNKIILDWCAPRILSNIKQQQKYLDDISQLPMPLSRPEMKTMKGTKQLELVSFM